MSKAQKHSKETAQRKPALLRSGGELFIESKYQHFPPIYTKQFQPFQMKSAAPAVIHSSAGIIFGARKLWFYRKPRGRLRLKINDNIKCRLSYFHCEHVVAIKNVVLVNKLREMHCWLACLSLWPHPERLGKGLRERHTYTVISWESTAEPASRQPRLTHFHLQARRTCWVFLC